jgi:hypothetical protein
MKLEHSHYSIQDVCFLIGFPKTQGLNLRMCILCKVLTFCNFNFILKCINIHISICACNKSCSLKWLSFLH